MARKKRDRLVIGEIAWAGRGDGRRVKSEKYLYAPPRQAFRGLYGLIWFDLVGARRGSGEILI
jgi:hypothetical protein